MKLVISMNLESESELTYSDPEEFNQAVRNDLEKGQTMLHLVLDEKRWIDPLDQEKVNSRGVIIASLQDIHKAFKDINTEEVPIYIEPGISGFPFRYIYGSYHSTKSISQKS